MKLPRRRASVAELSKCLNDWHLELDGQPFETHSSSLAYVRQRDGAPAVLKVSKPDSDEHEGARVLEHWGARAAVRVLARDARAILMERAVPGTTLVQLVLEDRDDEATNVSCDVISTLHTRPVPPGNWKTIEYLSLGFARNRTKARGTALTDDLIDRAEAAFAALCASQSERHLLHGDLHHSNILRDDARGWLAVDPKGIAGEVAYEVASVLHNPIPHFEVIADPKTMDRRVRIVSDRLHLSPDRILRWCFAKDILGHLWTLEDGGSSAEFARSLRVAHTAATLLGNAL